MVKKVNGKAKWVLVKVEGVCSASSGIFILLLWWGGQRETPIMAGDCSLYVGIGAIGKSTT